MDELRRDLERLPGYDVSSPLFGTGTVALTPAAIEALYRNDPVGFLAHAVTFVERHAAADWPSSPNTSARRTSPPSRAATGSWAPTPCRPAKP